ncbi:MAG: histidine kinase [Tannerella sp.]|jgi:LytS/YehU family sensor histidine kinase|nr:histidine kinase [Tannerella sp.]
MAYLIVSYFNIYVLVPRLLLKKKYALYGLTLSVAIIFMLLAKYCIKLAAFSALNISQTYSWVSLLDSVSYFAFYVICISGVSLTILLRLWMEDKMQIIRLESEHVRLEVDRMKEQINPQFLFDILAHITELTKTDPRKTSEMLLKLSQLLRYELYDCNREKVLLNSDIQFVSNYLKLEQLHDGDFTYTLSTTGNTGNHFVPPLLFISVVHGVLNKIRYRKKPFALQVFFRIDDDKICLDCSAKKADLADLPDSVFSNIRQRLDLLYHDNYGFSIKANGVELQLNTPNHV